MATFSTFCFIYSFSFHFRLFHALLIWKRSERRRVRPEWSRATLSWYNTETLIQSIGSAPKYSHLSFPLFLSPPSVLWSQVPTCCSLAWDSLHRSLPKHEILIPFLFVMIHSALTGSLIPLPLQAIPVYSQECVIGKFGVKYLRWRSLLNLVYATF